jgi:tRNA(adenine34) deaminase
MLDYQNDEFFMEKALQEAHAALDEGEVPIGAVIVHKGRVIARAHNRVEAVKDATAHAEIIAIGAASENLENWRLENCTLYVTLEPCPMCLGAIINSRISKLVYGAKDKRFGACGSVCDLPAKKLLNRELEVVSGVFADESRGFLQSFFKILREKKKAD